MTKGYFVDVVIGLFSELAELCIRVEATVSTKVERKMVYAGPTRQVRGRLARSPDFDNSFVRDGDQFKTDVVISIR